MHLGDQGLVERLVIEGDVQLNGIVPRFTVQRAPSGQGVFEQKLVAPRVVDPNWRFRGFSVKIVDMTDPVHLLKVRVDLGIEWYAEGANLSGFAEQALSAALG